MVSSGGWRVVPTTVRKKPVVGGRMKEGIKNSSKGEIGCDCHEDFDKCSDVVAHRIWFSYLGGNFERWFKCS